MKKLLPLHRVAFLAIALGTAAVTAAPAQTSTTTSTDTPASTDTSGGKHHKHDKGGGKDSVLTADEKARLKAAEKKVLASNPTLKTEHDQLKEQKKALKNGTASVEDRENYKALKHDFKKKMHVAMVAADPSLAPIFAKLKAAHKEGHGKKGA